MIALRSNNSAGRPVASTKRNMGAAPAYDTPLAPAQATAFEGWRRSLPQNLQGDADYDIRGAYLANAQEAANGHLPDTFKKPNHITFSTGSQYSTPAAPGGTWADASPGKYAFFASKQNLATHPVAALIDYFRQYEPDSTLVLPVDYRLPPGK